MADVHKNFAQSTLATAPSPPTTGLSLTVAAGDGARFGAPCNLTVWPPGVGPTFANAEIVRVSSIAGDVLTLSARAQEGTPARSVVAGWQIADTMTVATLNNLAAKDAANVFTAINTFTADVKGQGDFYEKSRTAPMGRWIDVAADNSYFAVGGPGLGNWGAGTINTFAYALIDKTLHLQIYCANGSLFVGGSELDVLLPAGLTASRQTKGSAVFTNATLPYETCFVATIPGSTWLFIYRNGLAAFPAGASATMYLEITTSVQ